MSAPLLSPENVKNLVKNCRKLQADLAAAIDASMPLFSVCYENMQNQLRLAAKRWANSRKEM